MRMKFIVCALLIAVSQTQASNPKKSEPTAQLVRIVELLGNPDHFNGKLVTVIGYLVMSGQNVNGESSLWLDKADYQNQVGDGMGVVPSEEMLRDSKELTGMYVRITGNVVTREWPHTRMLTLQNITECKIWSDPQHPRISLQGFGSVPK